MAYSRKTLAKVALENFNGVLELMAEARQLGEGTRGAHAIALYHAADQKRRLATMKAGGIECPLPASELPYYRACGWL